MEIVPARAAAIIASNAISALAAEGAAAASAVGAGVKAVQAIKAASAKKQKMTTQPGYTGSHNDSSGCRFVVSSKSKSKRKGNLQMMIERDGFVKTNVNEHAYMYCGMYLNRQAFVSTTVAADATTKLEQGVLPANYYSLGTSTNNSGGPIFQAGGTVNTYIYIDKISLDYQFTNFSGINCYCKFLVLECKSATDKLPNEMFNDISPTYQNGISGNNTGGEAKFAIRPTNSAMTGGVVKMTSTQDAGLNEKIYPAKDHAHRLAYGNSWLQFPEIRKFWKVIKTCPFQLQPGSNFHVQACLQVKKRFKNSFFITTEQREYPRGTLICVLHITETGNTAIDVAATSETGGGIRPQVVRGTAMVGYTQVEKHSFNNVEHTETHPVSFGFYQNPHPAQTGRAQTDPQEFHVNTADQFGGNRTIIGTNP